MAEKRAEYRQPHSPRLGLAALAVLLCLLSTAAVAKSPNQTNDSAPAQLFAEGQRRFSESDYLGAAEAFEAAYKLRPHFSVLCNIALCHERRADFLAAARYYRGCLKEGGSNSENAAQLRDALERAKARIALLELRTTRPGVPIFVDGRGVGRAPLELALNPGLHVVEARLAGAEPITRQVRTRGGETLEVMLELGSIGTPRPRRHASRDHRPSAGLRPFWFWGATALTAALVVAAAAVGARTLALKSEYRSAPTPEGRRDGLAHRTATNALIGLTAAAAVASTTLFFFTDFRMERAGAHEAGAGRVLGIGLVSQY